MYEIAVYRNSNVRKLRTASNLRGDNTSYYCCLCGNCCRTRDISSFTIPAKEIFLFNL